MANRPPFYDVVGNSLALTPMFLNGNFSSAWLGKPTNWIDFQNDGLTKSRESEGAPAHYFMRVSGTSGIAEIGQTLYFESNEYSRNPVTLRFKYRKNYSGGTPVRLTFYATALMGNYEAEPIVLDPLAIPPLVQDTEIRNDGTDPDTSWIDVSYVLPHYYFTLVFFFHTDGSGTTGTFDVADVSLEDWISESADTVANPCDYVPIANREDSALTVSKNSPSGWVCPAIPGAPAPYNVPYTWYGITFAGYGNVSDLPTSEYMRAHTVIRGGYLYFTLVSNAFSCNSYAPPWSHTDVDAYYAQMEGCVLKMDFNRNLIWQRMIKSYYGGPRFWTFGGGALKMRTSIGGLLVDKDGNIVFSYNGGTNGPLAQIGSLGSTTANAPPWPWGPDPLNPLQWPQQLDLYSYVGNLRDRTSFMKISPSGSIIDSTKYIPRAGFMCCNYYNDGRPYAVREQHTDYTASNSIFPPLITEIIEGGEPTGEFLVTGLINIYGTALYCMTLGSSMHLESIGTYSGCSVRIYPDIHTDASNGSWIPTTPICQEMRDNVGTIVVLGSTKDPVYPTQPNLSGIMIMKTDRNLNTSAAGNNVKMFTARRINIGPGSYQVRGPVPKAGFIDSNGILTVVGHWSDLTNTHMYIGKINTVTFEKIWEKGYRQSGAAYCYAHEVCPIPDTSDFVVLGRHDYSSGTPYNRYRIIVMRVRSNGDVVWTKRLYPTNTNCSNLAGGVSGSEGVSITAGEGRIAVVCPETNGTFGYQHGFVKVSFLTYDGEALGSCTQKLTNPTVTVIYDHNNPPSPDYGFYKISYYYSPPGAPGVVCRSVPPLPVYNYGAGPPGTPNISSFREEELVPGTRITIPAPYPYPTYPPRYPEDDLATETSAIAINFNVANGCLNPIPVSYTTNHSSNFVIDSDGSIYVYAVLRTQSVTHKTPMDVLLMKIDGETRDVVWKRKLSHNGSQWRSSDYIGSTLTPAGLNWASTGDYWTAATGHLVLSGNDLALFLVERKGVADDQFNYRRVALTFDKADGDMTNYKTWSIQTSGGTLDESLPPTVDLHRTISLPDSIGGGYFDIGKSKLFSTTGSHFGTYATHLVLMRVPTDLDPSNTNTIVNMIRPEVGANTVDDELYLADSLRILDMRYVDSIGRVRVVAAKPMYMDDTSFYVFDVAMDAGLTVYNGRRFRMTPPVAGNRMFIMGASISPTGKVAVCGANFINGENYIGSIVTVIGSNLTSVLLSQKTADDPLPPNTQFADTAITEVKFCDSDTEVYLGGRDMNDADTTKWRGFIGKFDISSGSLVREWAKKLPERVWCEAGFQKMHIAEETSESKYVVMDTLAESHSTSPDVYTFSMWIARNSSDGSDDPECPDFYEDDLVSYFGSGPSWVRTSWTDNVTPIGSILPEGTHRFTLSPDLGSLTITEICPTIPPVVGVFVTNMYKIFTFSGAS